MAVPGWGQIYNRQYIKLPIVYGGIGLFAYAAHQNHAEYRLYRNAFQYRAWEDTVEEGDENPAARFKADYEELSARFGPIGPGSIERERDNFRRNRDLSILGIGAVWAIGVLDAYVSAHLSDFDVGEDLTVSVDPLWLPGRGTGGLSLRLSW